MGTVYSRPPRATARLLENVYCPMFPDDRRLDIEGASKLDLGTLETRGVPLTELKAAE